MSNHAVDISAALVSVCSGNKSVLSGLDSDSPHAEFSGRAFDAFSKLDSDPVSERGAVLWVCLHAMREPRGNERDECHLAADWVSW